MSSTTIEQRSQRLQEISRQFGSPPKTEAIPLSKPSRPPTFSGPEDERRALAILQGLEINAGSALKKIYKTDKKTVWSYAVLYDGLLQVVEENGIPGVLEVLLKRFLEMGGNINLARKKVSHTIRSSIPAESGRLLQEAVESSNEAFVQLLVPHAQQSSINESLGIAFRQNDMGIIKLLLQYGANIAPYEAKVVEAANTNNFKLLALLVRSSHKVSQDCISQCLLPATTNGYHTVVFILMSAGANGDHDSASALMSAISTSQVKIVAIIVQGPIAPSGSSLDTALGLLLSASQSITNESQAMIELLLCAGPTGNAANEGLVSATKAMDWGLMELLLKYEVDVNYKGGAAIGDAIQHSRDFLVEMLLLNHTITPETASELVQFIPRDAPPQDRLATLSKLLTQGACGTHCNELLVVAASQDDMETVQMLINHGKEQNRPPVCSVDYYAASCIKSAILRNNLPMVKFLVHGGRASSFSLSQAFAVIPTNLTEDAHFQLVETLLRAGAKGPGVDEELCHVATNPQRSERLIEILVRHGATVLEETLLGAVSQGWVETLQILLSGKVTAATCTAAIPLAMKVHDPLTRFNIMSLLLPPATATGTDNIEVSQAVITILQYTPEDLPLLRLLCEQGKPNINSHDSLAVELAIKLDGLETLQLILQSHGGLPSAATVQRALKCATELPLTERHRRDKIETLLLGVKPQQALDDSLIEEIKFAAAATVSIQHLGVIQVLLDAGADVNARDGAPVWGSVNHPEIMDLLLSKRPNMTSLTKASQQAMNLPEPARCILSEKLWKIGVSGEVNSRSMVHLLKKEKETAIPMLRLLVLRADVNYKEGQAVRLVVKNMFIEGLDILLAARPIAPTAATKTAAFTEALAIQTLQVRLDIISKLLKAGIPKAVISGALVGAVTSGDFPLAELFLRHGASADHDGGQAVLFAANCGHNSILKSLVSGELCTKPSLPILTNAFMSAITALKHKGDRETHFQVVKTLLEAGVNGDCINFALVESVKDGDVNLKLTQLLYDNGASAEHNGGEAVYIACKASYLQTLGLLLQRLVSEPVLKEAYILVAQLPNLQRYPVIEQLLKAGKAIDRQVINSLTHATQQNPPDRRLIQLLLSYYAYDEGQAMLHCSKSHDIETLELLVNSPQAVPFISTAFNDAMNNDMHWGSAKGIEIMRLLLEKGASGDSLSEALCKAASKSVTHKQVFATEFLPVLLQFSASVDYQDGRVLQWVTMQMNLDLGIKLLPYASTRSKAMALPHLLMAGNDPALILKFIQAFIDSMQEDDEGVFAMFEHPNPDLAHVLFLALENFPRKPQICSALLDMGYNPNQLKMRELDPAIGVEKDPILCWALAQADHKISSISVENLIDAGANVNFRSKSGFTPLILAIQGQRPDIVTKLIKEGANVKVQDAGGISPLAIASSSGNREIMEALLQADAERNDGSLHDAARELRLDSIRLLIEYTHQPDYPSERHDGRSALAELCYKAVDFSPKPADLEAGVQCVIGQGADIWLKCVAQDKCAKTMLHYALDSSNPMPILTILLKLMWTRVNDDSFLYIDDNYTYSLTKYVEKDVFRGPPAQKADIIKLLRNKRIVDRFWANAVEADQPEDYCGAPKYVEEEVLRQKLRRKRLVEQEQDTKAALALKRFTVEEEVRIMGVQTAAEIRASNEKNQAEVLLMQERAATQLQIEMHSASEHDRVTAFRQVRERDHIKAIGDVQVATTREMAAAAVEQDRMQQMLQLEFVGSKISKENEGMQARLMIESCANVDADMIEAQKHERVKELRGLKLQEDVSRNQMEIDLLTQKFGTQNEGVKTRLAIEGVARKEDDVFDGYKHTREMSKLNTAGALLNKEIELTDKQNSGVREGFQAPNYHRIEELSRSGSTATSATSAL